MKNNLLALELSDAGIRVEMENEQVRAAVVKSGAAKQLAAWPRDTLDVLFENAANAIIKSNERVYIPEHVTRFGVWLKLYRYSDVLMPRAARLRGDPAGVPGHWEWMDALLSWFISLDAQKSLYRGYVDAKGVSDYFSIVKLLTKHFENLARTGEVVYAVPEAYYSKQHSCFPPELVQVLCAALDHPGAGGRRNKLEFRTGSSTLPPFMWCVMSEAAARGQVDHRNVPHFRTMSFVKDTARFNLDGQQPVYVPPSMAYHPTIRSCIIKRPHTCTEFRVDWKPSMWDEGIQWELFPCIGDAVRPFQHDFTVVHVKLSQHMTTEFPTFSLERCLHLRLNLTADKAAGITLWRRDELHKKYGSASRERRRVPADVGTGENNNNETTSSVAKRKK